MDNLNKKDMINANELRIGNYVHPCHKPLGWAVPIPQIISRVFAIEFFKCKLANDIELSYAEQEVYEYDLNMIEPIPITEEWLLKFGFEKYNLSFGYRIFYNIGNLIIELSTNQASTVYYTEHSIICFIKYVHQLQNLYFALTGIEVTING